MENKKEDKSWILPVLVMLIGAFMAILDSSIVNVAIPTMMNNFQTTVSKIQWVTTIYMLTLGVVVPASGWLGEFLGYKRLYIYSLIVFTLGSALCSLAWSEDVLIGARVIQALGGGMIMPTMMTMIYMLVPRSKMGSAMGIFGLTVLLAPAIGPTLGGYLVEYVNWRWIFTVNLPIGVIGTFLAIAGLPEFPSRKAGKFDLLGFVLSSAGLFCLLLALSQGQDWGWTSLPIVLLLYFGLALLGVFVYQELTTLNPLLDLRVFKYPTYALGNLMLVVMTIGLFGGLFYIPYFLQTVRGMGALQTGILMLPPALVSGMMTPISGRLYDRFGPKIPVGVGTLVLAYATYLFTKIDVNTPLSSIVLWNMLRAAGMGFAMMPLQTALMSVLPNEQIGRGSAIVNIVRQVASSLGLAVLTLILTNRIAVHSAYLGWTVSGTNLAGLLASGVADQQTVSALLQASIAKMSFVQSLNDMFFLTAAISALAFLPVLLIKKGDAGQAGRTAGSMLTE